MILMNWLVEETPDGVFERHTPEESEAAIRKWIGGPIE